MSRGLKKGLDYFPIDIGMDDDDKIYMLEAELGELAFGRLIKLFMAIYREGYYKKFGEEELLIFSGKKKIPISDLKILINKAVKRNLFDKNLYEKYEILTSSGIQKRYIEACVNRNQIVIHKQFCLVDLDDFKEKIRSKIKVIKPDLMTYKPDIIPDNSDPKPIIPDPIPQSKRNEKKRKQSTGNSACVLVDNSALPGPSPGDPDESQASGSSPPNGFASKLAGLLDDNFLFDPFQYDRNTIKEIVDVLCRQEAADLEYIHHVLRQTHADRSVESPEGYFLWAVKEGKYLSEWRARASPG